MWFLRFFFVLFTGLLVSYTPVIVPTTDAWAEGGDLLWQDQVPRGIDQSIDFGTVVTAHGRRVFVAGFGQSETGSTAFIRAYHARTGALLWEHQSPQAASAEVRLAADGKLVFAIRGTSAITAHDVGTGAIVDDPHGVFNRIVARHGMLIGSGYRGAIGDTDLLVRAYDASSGTLLWEDQFGSASDAREAAAALAVTATRVFVVGVVNQFTDAQSALLRAYDRRSGALLWHESISDPFSTMEAIVSEAGVVAIAGSRNRPVGGVGFIQAYDTRTGRFLWEHEVPLPDVPTFGFVVGLAAEGRRLFAAGASRGFLVQAHDIRTGTLLWQRESQAGLGGAMAITESRGIVFAVGPDDNDWLAQAYDAKTGDLVWEDRFDNAGSFDIARDDDAERGRLFVVGDVQTPTDFSDVLIRAYDADGKSRNKP